MEGDEANFSSVSWAPEDQAYGILHLLRRRAVMCQDFPKPAEVAHLKFLCMSGAPAGLPSSASSGSSEDGSFATPPPPPAEWGEATTSPSPPLPSQQLQPPPQPASLPTDVAAPRPPAGGRGGTRGDDTEVVEALGRVGAWWHICSADEVIVRQDVSIFSAELKRLRSGTWIQQAAPAEQFTRGPARGLVRLPVLPRGWVTADARSVGGPQYVEPAPRWCVVYGSGTRFGDVLVRAEAALDSEELAVLTTGDVVDQAGPQETVDGIVRMRILLPEWAAPPPPKAAEVLPNPAIHAAAAQATAAVAASRLAKLRVTVDASAVGGPVLLERKGGWT